MNYLITDTTENTGKIYINSDGENVSLEENAMVFKMEKEAEQKIIDCNWGKWAATLETDYPVNQ